jgi:hypothetical protein
MRRTFILRGLAAYALCRTFSVLSMIVTYYQGAGGLDRPAPGLHLDDGALGRFLVPPDLLGFVPSTGFPP